MTRVRIYDKPWFQKHFENELMFSFFEKVDLVLRKIGPHSVVAPLVLGTLSGNYRYEKRAF